MTYYEATAIREYTTKNGETKKQYTRLGTAFPFKEGDGFTLRLDAIPAPQDGTYTIMLFKPRPKDNQSSQSSDFGKSGGGADFDDEIPF